MARKRDFSGIGKDILTKSEKPRSLSDFIGVESNKNVSYDLDGGESKLVKKSDPIVRECISISKSDADLANELAVKCAAEGQKTTKADIYRASIRYFAKLSPAVMASKIRDVRKDKKTHN
ncbi:hypothetical protein [Legionella feeleii]|uniref:Uncharacterized protein n=1 Tax=Legionella feeleii TaxID=453 RepID=A0A0W0TW80_9GAMM|nr:hypothetical protein [Legionella feeleii]KTC99887.1 hypothetical protein Lfee_1297 [Legionella feeleii]SPX61986.1 Uncharacterised protein [Legionella feeleii]